MSSFRYMTQRCRSLPSLPPFRNYATRAPRPNPGSRPVPTARKPLQPLKPLSPKPTVRILDNLSYRRMEKMFEEGNHILFKTAPQRAFVFTSWSIALAASIATLTLLEMRNWDYKKLRERKIRFPYLIVVANMLGILLTGTAAAICFLRPSNFILAIKLVKDQGAFKLAVSRRSILPFRAPKIYMIPPSDLHLSRTVIGYFGAPEEAEATTVVREKAKMAAAAGGFFTKLWAVPYSAMRKVFFFEGVVRVHIPDPNGKEQTLLNLDTDGQKFTEIQPLLDIVTIDY